MFEITKYPYLYLYLYISLFIGKCFYASENHDLLNITEAKESCATRGGLIVPIKTPGVYYYLRAHASLHNMFDFHIGKMLFNLNHHFFYLRLMNFQSNIR